jgi:hypothetical protein
LAVCCDALHSAPAVTIPTQTSLVYTAGLHLERHAPAIHHKAGSARCVRFFAAPGHLLTLRIGDVMLAHLEDAAHFPDFALQQRVNFMDEEVRACGWCMCTRCTTHVSSGFKRVTA